MGSSATRTMHVSRPNIARPVHRRSAGDARAARAMWVPGGRHTPARNYTGRTGALAELGTQSGTILRNVFNQRGDSIEYMPQPLVFFYELSQLVRIQLCSSSFVIT